MSQVDLRIQPREVLSDDGQIDEQDGIRFEWEKSWLHVRASNTEPVIRIIAEAPSQKEARSLCAKVMEEV